MKPKTLKFLEKMNSALQDINKYRKGCFLFGIQDNSTQIGPHKTKTLLSSKGEN